jgi:hypothetical protein
MGDAYNDDLYNKIIKICCLNEDLNSFNNKDNTEVGERGVTISGG